jgi:GT2 family glycosyltransferase
MDVSIVIVSWRVRELLKKCLTSIYQETSNVIFEVFVADNASADGTIEMVKKDFPDAHVIANIQNIGFAAACNQAIKKSTGDFILLLNPDTIILDNAIAKTMEFMASTPQAGIVGCKITNTDGSLQPSVRRFPDLLSHIFILFKLHNFFPDFWPIRRYYMRGWPHQTTAPVDQIMGAFYMIRRAMLKQIGLLDQNFYIWYEEVDLCWRAKRAGWLTYFYPGAVIRHQKGESFKQQTPLKLQYIFNRSLLYYFFKNKNIIEYLTLIGLWPVSLLLALIVQLTGLKKKKREL